VEVAKPPLLFFGSPKQFRSLGLVSDQGVLPVCLRQYVRAAHTILWFPSGLPIQTLVSRFELWCHNIEGAVFSVDRATPDTTTEGRYVNDFRVIRIGNYAVPPFEVETRYARPVFTPIRGSPGAGFESGSIQNFRVTGIYRDIVNVTVAFEHLPPSLARIL